MTLLSIIRWTWPTTEALRLLRSPDVRRKPWPVMHCLRAFYSMHRDS